MFCRLSLCPACESSWPATVALALASSGIAIRVTIDEADPDGAAGGVVAAGERDGRVDGDVCGEQPERDRDQLLGASFGGARSRRGRRRSARGR